jgi:hypothetical protein
MPGGAAEAARHHLAAAERNTHRCDALLARRLGAIAYSFFVR